MNTLGIIAEYNPFHCGHLYHLSRAKEESLADYVVVVMSGNYVQRGTPAATDKYTRARMALACGADLVLELPVRYATGSAREFASAGMQSLHALGAVNAVSFGCEQTSTAILDKIAAILAEKGEELEAEISVLLKKGLSYPAARSQVLTDRLSLSGMDKASLSSLLAAPNTILATEYLCAMKKMQWNPSCLVIERKGAGYHDSLNHRLCLPASASGIRKSYAKTKDLSFLRDYIPPQAYEILHAAEKKSFPVTENDFSDYLFYALAKETSKSLLSYEGITANLASRIMNSYGTYQSFQQFAAVLHTKNYTKTHIQRALLHIILDIRKTARTAPLPWLRVLGLKKSASHLLKSATLPVITKVADAEKLWEPDSSASSLFKEDIRATHLYNHVLYSKFQTETLNEYRHGPVTI